MRHIIPCLLVACLSMPSLAQVHMELASQSYLVIEGRSTINRFACKTDALSGQGRLSADGGYAVLSLAVRDLDCGKTQMNRDLRTAMKAKDHPEIRFELVDASRAGSTGRLIVIGELTIAGVSRRIDIRPRAKETEPGVYRLRGEKQLRMSDFGVNPPTALAGLIKAHDEIMVRFDLVARTSDLTVCLEPSITDSHRTAPALSSLYQ